jgi:hypothetical protein
MRDITNITIEELIIHILDPEGQGLVLSSVDLPLEGSPALVSYISNHILTSIKDTTIKTARFRNINPEQPSGICRGLLRNEISLVEGSQNMARALYEILERDHRITPGDLALCLFQAENYPYSRFLAILKVDPSQIFQHMVREDARGNTYVSFEPVPKAFTSEKLQKCAIIQPLEPRHPEFDMLLLDRQRRGMEDIAIARFFSESFLDAKEAFDARKYTNKLYSGLVEAQNLVRDQMSEDEEGDFAARIQDAVSSRRMNIDTWIDDLPYEEPVKQGIESSLSAHVPQREFVLDRKLSHQLTRKVKFRGDFNLKLEVTSENYYTVVVSEERITDDHERGP